MSLKNTKMQCVPRLDPNSQTRCKLFGGRGMWAESRHQRDTAAARPWASTQGTILTEQMQAAAFWGEVPRLLLLGQFRKNSMQQEKTNIPKCSF